jgi:hypothetical protein
MPLGCCLHSYHDFLFNVRFLMCRQADFVASVSSLVVLTPVKIIAVMLLLPAIHNFQWRYYGQLIIAGLVFIS